jgi:hypothetical protein
MGSRDAARRGNVVSGLEPIGIAAAKAVGPRIGMAAFKVIHPDDWERRLAKVAARAARQADIRVSRRILRRWLKAPETEGLIDSFVLSGVGAVSAEAIRSLDRALGKARGWRRLSSPERIARAEIVVRAIADSVIKVQSPSDATDAASRRSSAEIAELRGELARGLAAGTQAEFDLALQRLPAGAREALSRLSENDNEAVRRIVMSLGDRDAEPRSLIPVWVSDPPAWLGDDATGWAALGGSCRGVPLCSRGGRLLGPRR